MCTIDDMLILTIDAQYLETRGELLCTTIDKWTKENGCESYSDTMCLEDTLGSLMVDYSFDVDNRDKIIALTLQILDRFGIKYTIKQK